MRGKIFYYSNLSDAWVVLLTLWEVENEENAGHVRDPLHVIFEPEIVESATDELKQLR